MLELGPIKTIHVASASYLKKQAVEEAIKGFTLFRDCEIKCYEVNSPQNPE